MNTQWLMQDWVTSHTHSNTLKFLQEIFHDCIISHKFSRQTLPPFSLDLNPCSYFLWEFLKMKSGHKTLYNSAKEMWNCATPLVSVTEWLLI
jgi:hypothetical protein